MAALTAGLAQIIPDFATIWAALQDAGSYLWGILVKGFYGLKDIGKWVWDLIKPYWEMMLNIAAWIWELIKPYWEKLLDIGTWIWDLIKPYWEKLTDIGTWIWNILSPAWEELKTSLQGVIDWVKSFVTGNKREEKSEANKPTTKARDALNKVVSSIFKKRGDFIVTPSGVIESDPSDYIIGSKKPRGMGGMNININIDKPVLAGSADIKTLVKAIELELYKTQRRYNSYVP